MHWNVAPDALPASARLVRVLDRWLNDYKKHDKIMFRDVQRVLCNNFYIFLV